MLAGRVEAVEERLYSEFVFPSLVAREEIAAMLPPTLKCVEIHHGLLTPEADAVHGVHLRDQSFRWFHRGIVGAQGGALFCDWLHWIGFLGFRICTR